jgi:hypothetical protein
MKTIFCVDASISKTMMQYQSGKLIRQPADFPQRGKSAYSSARSSYLPVKLAFMPARLRMASSSAYLTAVEAVTKIEMLFAWIDFPPFPVYNGCNEKTKHNF